MLDIKKLIREEIFLGDLDLKKSLPPTETYLGSDLFSRVTEDRVMVYYLDSSDQIKIPGEYLNLFQFLQTRDGEIFKEPNKKGLLGFISLGINLPGILLHKTDSRGIRNILSKIILMGTSDLRKIIPGLEPWTLSNINDTLEI